MPVSPTPTPPPRPKDRTKSGSVEATIAPARPSAVAASPATTTSRGLRRSTRWPATGPSAAPTSHTRLTVDAVAARVPPNSASSAGKNTGKVLTLPETTSIVTKASQSRGLARLSEGAAGTKDQLRRISRTPTAFVSACRAMGAASPPVARRDQPSTADRTKIVIMRTP